MATDRQKNITELMNGICRDRQFTPLEVSVIESCIRPEWKERKQKNIQVRCRSIEGKRFICQRLADMANDILKTKILIKPEHIQIYRRCWADEYTDRTGKFAYGFKNLCISRGYDPVTRLEIN